MKSWVRWLVVVCWHTLLFHFSFSHSLCHTHDKIALLQFKTSLNYSHSGNVDTKIGTWENGTDCCSWVGVTCHPISGRVIGIDVSSSGLFGAILSNNTLFHLSHLQSLNLASNFFFNFQLSSLFDGLVSLKRLNLSNSFFIGEIPSQISQLSKLESLDLSNNMLTWKESSWKKFLQNVTFLRELILDHVDMTLSSMSSLNLSTSLVSLSLESTSIQGNLKSDILCLPKLEQLHLSDNSYSLNGQHLPSLSCSGASLTLLDLSSNHFEGSIPVSFSNLTHLTFLDLSYNIYLNGSIPSSLLTFPSLTLLDLQLNQFSGQIPNVFPQSNSFEKLDLSHNNIEGQIPSSLSNLQHLVILDLSENEFSGQIPSSISNFHNLTTLILAKNELRGQIPSSLLNLQHLIFLNLAYNRLEGPLPNKITGLPNLTDLHLNDNLLNGTIPVWCLSLPSLLELDLSDNRFTGHISAISSQSLKSLYLCNNKLQGSIPPSIFSLVNLTGLCLSSNNFSGLHNCSFFTDDNYKFPHLDRLYLSSMGLAEFPKLSGKVPMLAQLDLSNNKLNGTLPEWLQEMNSLLLLNLSQNMLIDPMNQLSRNSGLLILDLSFNLLTGGISSSICNVSSLLALILSHNKLTGGIPPCLTNLKFLAVLDLQRNKLNGTLPSNFSMDSGLGVLNLNDNQLEGEIPYVIGELRALKGLNFSHNRLGGLIPKSIGNLTNLESLDLSSNMFTGRIPIELANMNFLGVLNLSCNNLVGEIPQGKHLDTFSNDSYLGNSGLCGFPLSMKCNNTEQKSPSSNFRGKERFGFGWEPVVIGYGCGMLFGIGLGFLYCRKA
ncbi:hypothetical protein LR48_Vigan07g028200 [Vigna angularis]|uniref:Leucine-rich repeat-containing N-terminal plant-type domain-containing protein n=1 Tax=Phaseolus angularis TaxID=3914 RepID=A0A0L9UV03_PHAAN|nr:hypothetical protein LR48_Vigan07g028200 [Vigna angularis]